MEPLKFAFPISTWLLRVAILILVYIIFFTTFRSFHFESLEFWIASAFALFSILLFVGGFIKSHTLTVVSGIALALGCGYMIFMHFVFNEGGFVAIFGVFGALALYFATSGNRKK
jgi:hypothetical protein